MKKNYITIVYAVIIIILTSFLSYKFITHKASVDDAVPELTEEKYDIDENKNVLFQYKNFKGLTKYIEESTNDYELLYFGRPTCSWCATYTPIVDEVMYENEKLILYFNPEEIADVVKINGTIQNQDAYNEILVWITNNSTGAIEKGYIKESEFDGQKVMRLFIPRYFLIKNGKIIDCYMPSINVDENGEIIKGETEEEKAQIKNNFKQWLEERK